MPERSKRLIFLLALAIFVLAFTLRLFYWATPSIQYRTRVDESFVFAGVPQSDDSIRFYKLGQNIAAGNGYRYETEGPFTMFDVPVYPYLLATFFRFLPGDETAIIALQCLLDATVCVLLVLLSVQLFRDATPGLLGGLAYAVYYPNYIYAVWLMKEPVFTFLLMVFFVVLQHVRRSQRGFGYILIGVLFGLTGLARAVSTYFLPFLLLVPWRSTDRSRAWTQTLLLFCGFLLVQGPWLAQGPRHFGRLVVGSTGGGQVLLAGVSVDYDGDWETQVHTNSPLINISAMPIPKHEQDALYKIAAREELLVNLRTRPAATALLMIRQVSRFYLNVPFKRPQSLSSYAVAALNATILLLALVGIHKAKRFEGAGVLTVFVFFYTSLHALSCALIRLSAPLMPILLLFAGFAAWHMVQSLAAHRATAAP